MREGIGAPVRRKEDRRLLTGAARFTDDLHRAGQARAVFVRSPHAHARVRGVDLAPARAAEGVLLALAADDLAGDLAGPIPSFSATPPFDVLSRDGSPAADAPQYPLARDKVRYPGEPVVLVVAETLAQACEAAELVAVDYEPLPAVVGAEQARRPDAPRIWDDRPGNLSFDWAAGDAAAVAAAFAGAAHVARVEVLNNRIAPVFMEPRAALAEFDAATGRWTLHAGIQSPHAVRGVLAEVLGVEPGRIRIVVPDMGGGFGARNSLYPEEPALLVAARRLGRPVKWTAERSEGFLADTQSRDHVLRGELALDAEGRFLALRAGVAWRHGAYLPSRSVFVIAHYLPPMLGGPYRIPLGHVAITGVFSNTAPLGAYRGIGRVEANYLTESLVEEAARVSGIDRVALRRRNLVERFPWTTPGGAEVRGGEFAANLERALGLADWDGFEPRRREARARGLLRGIGLGMYLENDGSTPTEYAEVEATAAGEVVVRVGTQDFGMSHATVFSQVAAAELGVPFDSIRVVFGDTDAVARGAGSHGSRSARMGGGAVVLGAREMIEQGRERAAEMLEAAPADLRYADGRYTIAGTDRSVGLADVAARAAEQDERLAGEADFATSADTHANGCHVCELTVDPETGRVAVERYVVVADAGRVINPLVVEGQLHGGAAQGIGQALLERVVVEPASGQLLSGSFMDYAIPKADDLPEPVVALNEVPEPDNPLGAKGVGENATTGAPAAVMNALRDALRPAGVERIDMPATPLAVWEALLRAGRGG